jgi:hypothetical protein
MAGKLITEQTGSVIEVLSREFSKATRDSRDMGRRLFDRLLAAGEAPRRISSKGAAKRKPAAKK